MAKSKDKRTNRLRELRRKALRIAGRARARGADSVARKYRRRARFYLVRIRKRRELLEQRGKAYPAFQPWMLNGRPGNIEPQVQKEIAIAVVKFGCVVTSTSTGPHTPSSYHFPYNNPRRNGKGRAVDIAGSWSAMCRYTAWAMERPGRYSEFFGPPNNRFIKHGRIYPGSIPNHYNHNHAAPKP